jgi:tRNA-binding protein
MRFPARRISNFKFLVLLSATNYLLPFYYLWPMASISDFEKVEIRVGRIIEATDFPEAKKPAYKLKIDFGPEVGIKKSSAQITKHYKLNDLPGTLVLAVVNFPPRQIGPFISEVLTLGVPDANGDIVLVVPDNDNAAVGGKLY